MTSLKIGPIALATTYMLLTWSVVHSQESSDGDFAQNWHQWRGPGATGVSSTAMPPTHWSETQNVLWKVPIEGNGSSTPIVWKERVFLLTDIRTERTDPSLPAPEDQPKQNFFDIKLPNAFHQYVVLCLDRQTGKEMWRRVANEKIPHDGHHQDNNYASASPTTDGERLYCWFGSGGLYCYDLNGNLLWKRDLGEVDMPSSLGEGTSPVVNDGKLVVVRDTDRGSKVYVLDSQTGEDLWQKDRDEVVSWATPVVVESNGTKQLITSGTNQVRSYDIESGDIIWECSGLSKNAIPSPVVDDTNVYCMSGYQGFSALAIPLNSKQRASTVWDLGDNTPYIPSPLLYDGKLYFNKSNSNILSCIDAKTGVAVFDRQRVQRVQQIYASPVAANGHVYVTGRNGTTVVLKNSSEYEVIAENRLEEPVNASLALVGSQLFLRSKQHLYCISDIDRN